MNQLISVLEWMIRADIFPGGSQWNIYGFTLFTVFWLIYPFPRLKRKLGWTYGALMTFLLAFTWISLIDEIDVLTNFPHYLAMGWKPIYFFYRWTWKTFFAYFTLKYARIYGVWGTMMAWTNRSLIAIGAWASYWLLVNYRFFSPYNYRSYQMTPYPQWMVYLFGNCVVWTLMTFIYLSF